MVTAGASWQVIPMVLVAADFQSINWSKTNGPNQPVFVSDTRQTGSMPFNLSWKDQVVYKVGVQVQPMPELKVRAGWNYGKNPLDKSRAFENIAFPAIAEHHVSLGAGYVVMPGLEINAGATYAPKVTISGENAAEQGIAAYSTSMSQIAIDVGAAWKF